MKSCNTLRRAVAVCLAAVTITLAAVAQTMPSPGELDSLMRAYGLVDVATLGEDGITVDLKYASTDNFVGRNMYGNLSRAYLNKETALSLVKALRQLKKIDPSLGFIIYDAARPRSAQAIMWSIVEGTDKEPYVAKPHRGGAHNFGMAVDISLTRNGVPLDMGTGFDNFTTDAHIDHEARLVKQGRITPEARANRQLLRRVLTDNDFHTLREEWWHFTRYSIKYARKHLPLLDF